MQKERNTGLNVSSSASRLWHPNDQRKEFDRRVSELARDFQALMPDSKPTVTRADLEAFFKGKGIYDAHKLDAIFEVLDDNRDGVFTKYE